MKKFLISAFSFITIFTITACGGSNAASSTGGISPTQISSPEPSAALSVGDKSIDENGADQDEAETGNETNILIAYFTMPETDGVDAVAGASRVVVNDELYGNTEYIARVISRETGGDMFAIETVQEYPGLHAPLLDFAKAEQEQNTRPELSAHVDNINNYDVIFVGYPNWWADLPQPLYTFLEEYDLSGKTIIPFCPHGGSGFSRTINTIATLQPDAEVITNGFTVSRNNVATSENGIISWLNELMEAEALAIPNAQ